MNWWDRINTLARRSRDVVVAPQYMEENRSDKAVITDPVWVSSPMYGSPRNINYQELEVYEKNITVQAAANFIIDSIATNEWSIIPEEGVGDDMDDGSMPDPTDAIKFFKSEGWEDSFEVVLRGVISDILFYDAGVIVLSFPEFCYDENKTLIRDDIAPLQLRARDGRSFMRQVTIHGDMMKYWQYSFSHAATKPIEFEPEEVMYIQERPSTRSPYGTSKLDIVKNVADLMMATQLGHRSEQENALQIGGIISHADVTDTDKLKRLSALYNSTLKGEKNRKRWLTTGGNVTVTPVSATVGDDSWIKGSEFYQQQILTIFKTPKTVLGITSSDTNRATALAQSTNFKRMGVSTMLTLLERVFTRDIVKKYFSPDLKFSFVREIDLSDEAIRADVDAKNISTGLRTINELRRRDGLEELEESEPEPEPESEPGHSGSFSEFEGIDALTSEEIAEMGISKGLTECFNKKMIHVPASGKRAAYSYERVSAQTQHTDVLLYGVDRFNISAEKKLQAIDTQLGIDPTIGKLRRERKASERHVLFQMSGRGASPSTVDYTATMKSLLDSGDIEQKSRGKGYKITTQGKARIKSIDAAILRYVENVPTKSADPKAQQKKLSAKYMGMVNHNARRFNTKEE